MAAIATQYNVPIDGLNGPKYERVERDAVARSSAKALKHHLISKTDSTLPLERVHLHEQVLREYFGLPDGSALERHHLMTAAALPARSIRSDWVSHGKAVVERIVSQEGHEGLEAFVKGWRAHFLEAMQPRYMHPHWGINNRVRSSGYANMIDDQPSYKPEASPTTEHEENLDEH
jgi:hypothetical protein